MLSSHMTFCAKSNDVEFDTCSLLEVFRTVKWPRFSWTLKVRVVSSISDELPQTVCSPARVCQKPPTSCFVSGTHKVCDNNGQKETFAACTGIHIRAWRGWRIEGMISLLALVIIMHRLLDKEAVYVKVT